MPAGAQGLGQLAPEGVQPGVGHLQDAADVGGLAPVEEVVRLGGVRVAAAVAPEQAEGHEGVEEVTGAARVQAQAPGQGRQVQRPAGQLGEDAQFHGAEQGLGAPEAEAELQDVVGAQLVAHANLLLVGGPRGGLSQKGEPAALR
jgi:hypothetical protein